MRRNFSGEIKTQFKLFNISILTDLGGFDVFSRKGLLVSKVLQSDLHKQTPRATDARLHAIRSSSNAVHDEDSFQMKPGTISVCEDKLKLQCTGA